MKNVKKLGATMLAVVALAGAAWFLLARRPPAVERGACRGCNVLLITIDTLRVDRVGAFGGRPLTPNIDRIAAEGLKLTRTYASAPLTLPSHASILTGVSPPVHGLRTNGLFRLGPNIPTLATLLHDAGYRTGAFVGSFVLDARFGLNRGFDVYDDRYGEKPIGDPAEGAERRAEDVVKPALSWILEGGGGSGLKARKPWFSWVHLYDPHEPYRAPEPYASRHEPYDAEVAYTDAMVGRLLDELRSAGELDRTLVAIAADHGESLGEHGERTHGVFAYDVTMRVPWMLWAGGKIAPGSTDRLTRLVDVAPTTLDLVGVAPPSDIDGRSLATSSQDARRSGSDTSAYVEAMDANLTRNWAPLTGIVVGHYKLIELPIPELYDLSSDPSETTNIFSTNGEQARTLTALLRDATSRFAARGSSSEKTTLSVEARQRLQALGYVATSADPQQRQYTDADDPKRLIGPSNDLQRAVVAFNGGDRTAMATVRTIAQQHPSFATAAGVLAAMQRDTGDLRGAIATLEDLARRGIADPTVMLVLAGYLQQSGAPERALAVVEAVVAAHPDFAEGYNSLGVINMRLGRHRQARAALQKMLELDPTSAKAYENLGADELAAGDPAAAVADLRHAIDLDPRLWDALYNLALVLETTGRHAEALPYIERFVNEAPRARYAPDIERLRALLQEKK